MDVTVVLVAGYCTVCLVLAWLRSVRMRLAHVWSRPGTATAGTGHPSWALRMAMAQFASSAEAKAVLGDVGWSAALLAVAVDAADVIGTAHWQAWLPLAAAGAVVVVTPRLTGAAVAAALAIQGLAGFWLAHVWYVRFSGAALPGAARVMYGVVPARTWAGALVPVQACVFLAAGLWLGLRMASGRSWLPGARAERLAWALPLLPLVALTGELFGGGQWSPAASWYEGGGAACVAAALALVVVAAAWAADLMVVALGLFGLYGICLGGFWGSIAVPGGYAAPVLYGAVPVHGQFSADCAGIEGALFLVLAGWLARGTLVPHMRELLQPPGEPGLARRVRQLTETRAEAVDSAAAELRRIERDLHDGAQARLVALGISLRVAERLIPVDPEGAAALVAEAREASARALADLRDLVRGIYPPVLADRGLGAAVRALTLDTPLPTDVEIDLPGRPELPVESACYFAVAEALANAVKHSGARRVRVDIRYTGSGSGKGALHVGVADDGTGGADPENGTGLAGVEKRLAAFDGVLAVSSPMGGPTLIAMEVPCALSSPRTSSS